MSSKGTNSVQLEEFLSFSGFMKALACVNPYALELIVKKNVADPNYRFRARQGCLGFEFCKIIYSSVSSDTTVPLHPHCVTLFVLASECKPLRYFQLYNQITTKIDCDELRLEGGREPTKWNTETPASTTCALVPYQFFLSWGASPTLDPVMQLWFIEWLILYFLGKWNSVEVLSLDI